LINAVISSVEFIFLTPYVHDYITFIT